MIFQKAVSGSNRLDWGLISDYSSVNSHVFVLAKTVLQKFPSPHQLEAGVSGPSLTLRGKYAADTA